jgi:hypothetical protein
MIILTMEGVMPRLGAVEFRCGWLDCFFAFSFAAQTIATILTIAQITAEYRRVDFPP